MEKQRKLEGSRRPRSNWCNPVLEFLVAQLPLGWADMLTVQDLSTLFETVPAAVRPVISTKLFGSVSHIQVEGQSISEWLPIAQSASRHGQMRQLSICGVNGSGLLPSMDVIPANSAWTDLIRGSTGKLRVLTLFFRHSSPSHGWWTNCVQSLACVATSLHTLCLVSELTDDGVGEAVLSMTFPNLTKAVLGLRRHDVFQTDKIISWTKRHGTNLTDLRLVLPLDTELLEMIARNCPNLVILALFFNTEHVRRQPLVPSSFQLLMTSCTNLVHVHLGPSWHYDEIVSAPDMPRDDSSQFVWHSSGRQQSYHEAKIFCGRDLNILFDREPQKTIDAIQALCCTSQVTEFNAEFAHERGTNNDVTDCLDWLLASTPAMETMTSRMQTLSLLMWDADMQEVARVWNMERCQQVLKQWPRLVELTITVVEMEPPGAEDDYCFESRITLARVPSTTTILSQEWTLVEKLDRGHQGRSLSRHWHRVWPGLL